MKNLIRRILKEDDTGTGTWKKPLVNETSGDVPLLSYSPEKINKDGNYTVKPVSKRLFVKAVELLIKMKDSNWFERNYDLEDSPWYRADEMKPTLKILGLSNTGIEHKVFWAAVDNMEGIKDGSIINYDQLNLRAFKTYAYPMYEEVRVFKTIHWRPETSAFSEGDASANIVYDEIGRASCRERV